jgi:hypothetical protein
MMPLSYELIETINVVDPRRRKIIQSSALLPLDERLSFVDMALDLRYSVGSIS